MKKILIIALAAMFLAGCTEITQFGPCVGVYNADRNPKLTYKMDEWNVILAIIFSETIIVPAIVIFNETYCPVGVK